MDMKLFFELLTRLFAAVLLILLLPFLLILYFCVKITSKGPFIFCQKRMGKNRNIFTIYKIRTMVENAEKLKQKIYHLNQVNGPVFKIKNDPRYTQIGKLLSHTGLDEVLQLINIVKGEMAFVGPRPLPVKEALKVPKKYQNRFAVLPGITSAWIINGAHRLTFDQWMKLDLEYVKNRNFKEDFRISFYTIKLIINLILKNLKIY